MKTQLASLFIFVATGALGMAQPVNHFTVHEWGTFTSVQGGDGQLQPWRPLQSSELPAFVHDWGKPGINVLPRFLSPGGKTGLVTLQRMETPVIYFYSDDAMTAEVSVGFPKGILTEWYPRPNQIGPAELTRIGLPTNLPPVDAAASLTDSRVTWRDLTLVPPSKADWSDRLPVDEHGRNYFAARETGSDFVQTGPVNGTNETEKFLFYRGAGSFATPFQVTMAGNRFALSNTGMEPLKHLLLVRVKDGYGEFAPLGSLAPGQTNWQAGWDGVAQDGWKRYPLVKFQEAIGAHMASALESEGLYKKEARAMVNTWRDSWFTEAGTRVLYVLPRAWTDGILPMTLTPEPSQLVRVMVGRAEIITPEVQDQLLAVLTRATNGDPAARQQAGQTIKQLGRYAMPALTLALNNDYTNAVAELGAHLLMEAMYPVRKLQGPTSKLQ